MKKIVLLLLVLTCTRIAFTQEYFPLQLGNRFKYNYSWYRHWTGGGSSSGDTIIFIKITDTSTFYGKKYFFCTGFSFYSNAWLRVDSITKSLYKYDNSNSCSLYYKETLIDSLGILQSGLENYCSGYYFHSKSNDTLFNAVSFVKFFSKITNGEINTKDVQETHRYYNSLFGLKNFYDSWSYGPSGGTDNIQLIGCIIDGTGYGDTALTNVNLISSRIPEIFSLKHNYPNPFNSTTNIKFQILNAGNAKITVFDIMGREVATLVNEKLQPGTYEVRFDAGNLPSGIYFYQLKTENYIETKKLVLLK